MKQKRMLLAIFMALTFLLSMITAGADDSLRLSIYAESKICPELFEIMEKSEQNDLIPVWIFRTNICLIEIERKVYDETGMRAEIFENPGLFEMFVIHAVIKELGLNNSTYNRNDMFYDEQIISTVRRHIYNFDSTCESFGEFSSILSIVDDTVVFTQRKGLISDKIQFIAWSVICELVEVYRKERLAILNREVMNSNERFGNNIPISREILYVGEFTTTHILKATPDEIRKYASFPEVIDIAYYDVTLVATSERLNWVLAAPNEATPRQYQTGAARMRDAGMRGNPIVIGVLEADSTITQHEHLVGANVETIFAPGTANIGMDVDNFQPFSGPPMTHATMTTCIIVGQRLRVPTSSGGVWIEGIVPRATVIQASFNSGLNQNTFVSNMIRGINILVNRNVHIINMAFGFQEAGNGYHRIDFEVDRIVRNSNTTVVISAGNEGRFANNNFTHGNVTSPGKALNAITVGNALTIDRPFEFGDPGGGQLMTQPFPINIRSSFMHENFLPNKPDIVAPGTGIFVANWNNSGFSAESFSSGTSVSAPIVTGIIAQQMHLRPALRTSPHATKAHVLLDARPDMISSSMNDLIHDSLQLRQRSGAGMAYAPVMVYANTGFATPNNSPITTQHTWRTDLSPILLNRGQRIRMVLVHGNSNVENQIIRSVNDLDNVNLRLVRTATTQVFASSVSNRNNVEIIDYTSTAGGWYTIQHQTVAVRNTVRGVPVALYYRVFN
jgi:hypothetical protein